MISGFQNPKFNLKVPVTLRLGIESKKDQKVEQNGISILGKDLVDGKKEMLEEIKESKIRKRGKGYEKC